MLVSQNMTNVELTLFHISRGALQISGSSLNIYLFDEWGGGGDSKYVLKYVNPAPSPRKILFSTKPSTPIF